MSVANNQPSANSTHRLNEWLERCHAIVTDRNNRIEHHIVQQGSHPSKEWWDEYEALDNEFRVLYLDLVDRIRPAISGQDDALVRIMDQLANAVEAQRDALHDIEGEDKLKNASRRRMAVGQAAGECRRIIRAVECRLAKLERGLPGSGTLTFLMTDIKDSTALRQQDPDAMAQALRRHDNLGQEIVNENRGVVVRPRGEGDSLFCVFTTAGDALQAAFDLQQALLDENWPTRAPLEMRIGIHTGEVALHDGDYRGTTVDLCARIRGEALPGQILCSEITYELAKGHLRMRAEAIGERRLKGFADAVPLIRVVPNLRPPRRLLTLPEPLEQPANTWDRDWIAAQQLAALAGLQDAGFRDFMQVWAAPVEGSLGQNQADLRAAVATVNIHAACGMPVNGVSPSGPEIMGDGIRSNCQDHEQRIYHTWSLRGDGSLYLLQSLIEDAGIPGQIVPWVRLTRVVELLQLAHRLYTAMGLSSDETVRLGIHHVGLRNRVLDAGQTRWAVGGHFQCSEESCYVELAVPVDLTTEGLDLPVNARALLEPLFMLFGCYRLEDDAWDEMIGTYWSEASNWRHEDENLWT